MNRNPEEKIARQRLSVLELAQVLGNVSEACRRRGISRTTFYEYKQRFEQDGLEGLRDLPPIPKSHPMATPEEHVRRLLEVSLEHPAWGCDRLSAHLKLEGVSISGPTIQRILNKNDLRTRYDRWLRLEAEAAEEGFALTEEQLTFLERHNPQVKERHVESSRPGELLCQDTFYVGRLKGVGKVYLHAIVDSYSSYAFGLCKISAPTHRSSRKLPYLYSTTTPCRSTKGVAWNSAPCSPTTARSSAARPSIPTNSTSR